jgi:hypothetical protein
LYIPAVYSEKSRSTLKRKQQIIFPGDVFGVEENMQIFELVSSALWTLHRKTSGKPKKSQVYLHHDNQNMPEICDLSKLSYLFIWADAFSTWHRLLGHKYYIYAIYMDL